jgi:glycolate oxidase iron-sulfur subunit
MAFDPTSADTGPRFSGWAFAGVDLPEYEQLVQCMRCGACLPVCPTYAVTRLERDSPRGRIRLIKAAADGDLGPVSGFRETIAYCLDCRACETACPAGVRYGELVEAARAGFHALPGSAPVRLARRFLLRGLFASRGRLRLAAWALRAFQRSGLDDLVTASGVLALLPGRLREAHALQPRRVTPFPRDPLPARAEPAGTPRLRVGLLAGCVMDYLYHDVNVDTVEVLVRNGCEVVVPPRQGCCGSIHGHTGDVAAARDLARRLIEAFEASGPLDAVAVNAAGCGYFMKEYGRLLAHEPAWARRAKAFAAKVRDVSELLVEIGVAAPRGALPGRVAYHDACHLAHAQRITRQPREVLRAIPGLALVDLPESTWCCGSAGIYNVVRPDDARVFLDRKIRNIAATGATIVAMGNPGCALQVEAGLRAAGMKVRVAHPVSLLAEAYRNEAGREP